MANRGLPPPSAMTLPSPTQSSALGQLPDRWSQGNEETQRTWLHAKMEEERRRQEEERRRQEEQRTQQENIRLEVRRTELEMLREALRGGMPAQLVPVIFTGGGALAGTSSEWASQYMAEMHRTQQQLHAPSAAVSPELRRNSRLIASSEYQTPQPSTISGIPRSGHPPPPPPLPSSMQHPSSQHHTGPLSQGHPPPPPPPLPGYSPFHMSPARHHPHGTMHNEPNRSTLPRINTDEMNIAPAPHGPPGLHAGRNPRDMPAVHYSPPSQGRSTSIDEHRRQHQQQPDSSPSIFFHHWQPPASQTNSSTPNQSTSPSTGKNQESPFPQQNSLAPGQDVPSPKKRKLGSVSAAGGGHGQSGTSQSGTLGQQHEPTFSPSYTSGSSSQGVNRRRNHIRHWSDVSSRGYEPYPKTSSRYRKSDAGQDYTETVNDSRYGQRQYSVSRMTTQDESPEYEGPDQPRSQSNTLSESRRPSIQPYTPGSEKRIPNQKQEMA